MRKILFLIPFFNEEENLKKLSKLIETSAIEKNFTYKILFLDDCSSDISFEIINQYKKETKNEDLIIFKNENNLGHGKSLLKLFSLSNNYLEGTSDIVTLDSDMEIDDINFYEIFDTDISVICKRKRFEEGLFRAFVTFIAEILIFLKTRKLWRDANCPLRLYKINDFILIKNKIPSGILTPNIVSTMFFLLLNLPVSRIPIKLKSEKKNSGVTWKDKNPLKKYMKILSFSFKSFGQVIKIKL